MPYRVQIENFDGPLDLLLFLIRKNEVEIYDIPIADITQQYMEYLEVIELLDLENAGDFILMAATLIRIKVQMLLPRPELEGEEAEDPREELVRKLLEYQRFKEVAQNLGEIEVKQRGLYPRSLFEFEFAEAQEAADENPVHEVTLYDLMAVFVEMLKKVPPRNQYTVAQIPVSVEEQSAFIMDYLEKHEKALFTDMLAQFSERIFLIVTFISLLELVRSKQVKLNQSSPFAEIWIRKI